jgi:hypothetical protein
MAMVFVGYYPEQMVKTPRQQGRSEREAEAYFHLYVEV